MSDEELWICPRCTEPVGSERVLELPSDAQVQGWHPDCYQRHETQP